MIKHGKLPHKYPSETVAASGGVWGWGVSEKQMIEARDAFYSGLDKGEPCHWRDGHLQGRWPLLVGGDEYTETGGREVRQAIRVGGITFMTGIACSAVAGISVPYLAGMASLIIAFIGGWLAFFAQVGDA